MESASSSRREEALPKQYSRTSALMAHGMRLRAGAYLPDGVSTRPTRITRCARTFRGRPLFSSSASPAITPIRLLRSFRPGTPRGLRLVRAAAMMIPLDAMSATGLAGVLGCLIRLDGTVRACPPRLRRRSSAWVWRRADVIGGSRRHARILRRRARRAGMHGRTARLRRLCIRYVRRVREAHRAARRRRRRDRGHGHELPARALHQLVRVRVQAADLPDYTVGGPRPSGVCGCSH